MPAGGSAAAEPPARAAKVAGVALFWLAYLVILWLGSSLKSMVPDHWGPLVWGLPCALAIIALTLALARRAHRSPVEVGLRLDRGSGVRLLAGLVVGTVIYASTVGLISWLVTPIHLDVVPRPSAGALALAVAGTLALASMEELGFRGYPLRTLREVLGPWQAQSIVALAFGLSHIAFGWGWQPVVFGVLPSALLFGALAEASGELALPIGAHAALNLGRFATGETSAPGWWSIRVDDQAIGQLASQAPVLGLVWMLVATAVVWLLHRHTPLTRGQA